MSADAPTILATSGGFREGRRTRWEFSAFTEYAIDLAGVTGRAPRVCFVATALGDNPTVLHWLTEAAQVRGLSASHLTLFPMPNVDQRSTARPRRGVRVRWQRGRPAGDVAAARC